MFLCVPISCFAAVLISIRRSEQWRNLPAKEKPNLRTGWRSDTPACQGQETAEPSDSRHDSKQMSSVLALHFEGIQISYGGVCSICYRCWHAWLHPICTLSQHFPNKFLSDHRFWGNFGVPLDRLNFLNPSFTGQDLIEAHCFYLWHSACIPDLPSELSSEKTRTEKFDEIARDSR